MRVPSPLNIHTYLDWRAFVRAWLAASHARTRAKLAKALGCKPPHVTAILHSDPSQRRTLTDEYLERLPSALGLDDDAADFLRLLVHFDRAEEGSETQNRLRAQIYANKRFREAHRATVDQYELFSRWENIAVLALAESPSFKGDPRWLRETLIPPVQLQEAQAAFDLLLRLGMLRYDDQGRARPVHGMIVAGDYSNTDSDELRNEKRAAGQTMHRWMLTRAQRALTEFPTEDRYFNAGTELVPESRLPELQRMFQRWQAEWMELCARPQTKKDDPKSSEGAPSRRRARVYRLNLQFFPLSGWVEEKS